MNPSRLFILEASCGMTAHGETVPVTRFYDAHRRSSEGKRPNPKGEISRVLFAEHPNFRSTWKISPKFFEESARLIFLQHSYYLTHKIGKMARLYP